MPIPVDTKNQGSVGSLRSGRMIYEWIKMAESDLVIDATSYKYFAKTDITNFYSSVYTHSVAWAIAGSRETAFEDKQYKSIAANRSCELASPIKIKLSGFIISI